MRKVLLTGIFGNTGQYICRTLLENNIKVVGFDIKTLQNEKNASDFNSALLSSGAKLSYYWGDLRDKASIKTIFEEHSIDVVIHIAFIIPPFSELNPELARKVNISGSKNLIEVVEEMSPDTRFIFSSSVATYGYHHHNDGVVNLDDDLSPINNYAEHKIEVEKLVKSSILKWTILKFSAVMNPKATISDEAKIYAKSIAPESKIEPVHVEDLAIAVKNAVINDATIGKTYIIAGGEQNQTTYGEYITNTLNCFVPLKYDDIPWGDFQPEPYYLHWYDTKYSEEILEFQNKSIDDYLIEFKKNVPPLQRFLAKFAKKKVIKETFGL